MLPVGKKTRKMRIRQQQHKKEKTNSEHLGKAGERGDRFAHVLLPMKRVEERMREKDRR